MCAFAERILNFGHVIVAIPNVKMELRKCAHKCFRKSICSLSQKQICVHKCKTSFCGFYPFWCKHSQMPNVALKIANWHSLLSTLRGARGEDLDGLHALCTVYRNEGVFCTAFKGRKTPLQTSYFASHGLILHISDICSSCASKFKVVFMHFQICTSNCINAYLKFQKHHHNSFLLVETQFWFFTSISHTSKTWPTVLTNFQHCIYKAQTWSRRF
jgi:hypothetical protein